MFRTTTMAVACALACSLSQRANAQQTTTAPKVDPKLAAEAKITLDSARVLALQKVPHGTVASEELEREHGRLIYSFDVKVPGKPGIQEVTVNAITGKVLGVHHESAAAEAKEAREESAAAHKDSTRHTSP